MSAQALLAVIVVFAKPRYSGAFVPARQINASCAGTPIGLDGTHEPNEMTDLLDTLTTPFFRIMFQFKTTTGWPLAMSGVP